MAKSSHKQPIGVFDSGVGGLTVVQALRACLPSEDIVYLGDTARVPYGTKSAHTVTRYALQAARPLLELGVKCLVVACNTASSVSLRALRQTYYPTPIIGVVEPGAAAGCLATQTGHVGVLATESTVRGGAYPSAMGRLRPSLMVSSQACSLFVALAEEGWHQTDIAIKVAERYLQPMLAESFHAIPIDCFVLGCTHFPLLSDAIAHVVGPDIKLVDSAQTTAMVVRQTLSAHQLLRPLPATGVPILGELKMMVTDSANRFAQVGERFLGDTIASYSIEVVDL